MSSEQSKDKIFTSIDQLPSLRRNLYDYGFDYEPCNNSHCANESYDLGLEYLIFSGGGVSGMAYLGVAEELEKQRVLSYIRYFIGSSSGAVICTLLALGADSKFLHEEFRKCNMSEFLDVGGRCYSNNGAMDMFKNCKDGLFDLIKHFGAARGYKFVKWMEEMFCKLGWSPETTFAELYNKTGKMLVITGTSINTHSTLYFSRSSYPYLKIIDAAHMSMVLPFVYQPVLFEDVLCSKGPRIVIDGGVLNNLALSACDVTNEFGQTLAYNRKAVGFILVENGQIAADYQAIDSIYKFSVEVVKTLHTNMMINQSQQPYFWDRVVPIDVHIDTMAFDASREDLNKTVEAGRTAMRGFLNSRRAMIKEHGRLPNSLFIPSDQLVLAGVTRLSNTLLENTKIYETNPCNFASNKIVS